MARVFLALAALVVVVDGSINLARGRPTAQSSLAFQGSSSRAVDGNRNPRWPGRSCTHTNIQNRPWWRVDLGATKRVDRVVVVNRLDCCSQRLQGFQVHVGDNPNVLANPTCGGPQGAGGVINVNCGGKTGRYVGISLPGRQYLTLCEVEVYGGNPAPPQSKIGNAPAGQCVASGGNLARGHPTAQSSLAFNGPASRAVDGNRNPMWPGRSCTHTNIQNRPWWRVDLGAAKCVNRVVVVNRKDCCSERLRGFKVHVGDNPNVLANPTCGGPQGAGGVINVNCGGKTGRYVGISLPGRQYLTLCEVEVYGGTPVSNAPAGPGKSSAGAGGWLTDGITVINSAGYTGPRNGPEKALDGKRFTFWNPQRLPRGHNNWFIAFDLGAVYSVTGARITNWGDRTHDVTAFSLESADSANSDWTEVFFTSSVKPGTRAPQDFGGFSGSGRYWRFTATKTASGYQPWLRGFQLSGVPRAEDCQVGNGASYRGTVAVTKTGRTCQRWDTQTPHRHNRTPARYPSSGLEQNYCRNPDGVKRAWCYTTDRGSRWEYCDIPICGSGPLADSPAPIDIQCGTQAKKMKGDTYTVSCPAGCTSRGRKVWGTDVYTDDSSICRAAIHAGKITDSGGVVAVRKLPGQSSYRGSSQNGVKTRSYGKWGRSFGFISAQSSPGSFAGPGGFLSDNIKVIASAGYTGAHGGPEKALDGKRNTFWNPQRLPRSHNNWFITVDLGAVYSVTGARITNFGDRTHDVTAFKLETTTAANAKLKDIFSTTNVKPGTRAPQDFGGFSGSGRYWRFTATKTASGYQPWLIGFQFYGVKAPQADSPAPIAIQCGTQAKKMNGDTFTVSCPAGCASNSRKVWGTDVYTDDSSICRAAIHAGKITDSGGVVAVRKLPGQSSYRGSSQNGVKTRSYGKWGHSFGFISAGGPKWRDDGKCGAKFPAPGATPGECNPDGDSPCCSVGGVCGSTLGHCSCSGCIDYSLTGNRKGTIYYPIAQAKNYNDAKAHCAAIKGRLADIKSQEIHDFLVGVIKKVNPKQNYWVGLHDTNGKFEWAWADGTPLKGCSMKNWAPGEPNNPGRGQNCVQLWSARGFKWDNDYCKKKKFFICMIGPGEDGSCAKVLNAKRSDPAVEYENERRSLKSETEELLTRSAHNYNGDTNIFHNLVLLSKVERDLKAASEFGPGAMERLNEITRDLSEIWEQQEADEDDDTEQDARELEEEEDADMEEEEETLRELEEFEEDAMDEVDESEMDDDAEQIVRELEEEENADMEEDEESPREVEEFDDDAMDEVDESEMDDDAEQIVRELEEDENANLHEDEKSLREFEEFDEDAFEEENEEFVREMEEEEEGEVDEDEANFARDMEDAEIDEEFAGIMSVLEHADAAA